MRSYLNVNGLIEIMSDVHARIPHIPIILILDCCHSEIGFGSTSRGGLSNCIGDRNTASNIFIMCATAGQDKALDESQSGFTRLLLEHMTTNENIEDVSKKI